MVGDILRGLKHEAMRLMIYLGLLVLFSPVLFIPFLGQVVLAFISIRYLAWDGLDYCMSRRRFGFRQKMAFLARRRMRTVGYGVVSFLMLMIPMVQLFVLPLNAVGGTLLFCRIVDDEKLDL